MEIGGGDTAGATTETTEVTELHPPRHRVSPRAVRWWTVQALLTVLSLLVPVLVALVLWEAARGWLAAAAIALTVLGGAYVVVMPRWRFRVHRWEATEDAVYTSEGWLSQEWRVAPMSRIQTVDTQRGPVQQLFRLSTVTVTTASAAGALQLTGLDRELAAELVRQLTATTQATPGDAT